MIETASTTTLEIDGRQIAVRAGITVAAALLNTEIAGFRRSATGETRGPLCGMGSCHECRVTIDERPQQRACMVVVRDGMRVATGG